MQRSIRRKALVLGEDLRAVLGVVRSLGRADIDVHIGWHPADSPACHSRYAAQVHALPAYGIDGQWKSALIALMQRERFDLVIPCTDPAQIPLQAHRHDLEPLGRIYLLEDAVFRIVNDKFAVNDLARAAGVPVAREHVIRDDADRENARADLRLPVVVKPRASYDPQFVGQRQAVRKAYDWPTFDKLVRAALAVGPVAVQENFIGHGVGVELLLHEGTPLLEFQHVRLHEPLMGGGSCYRQGVAVTPALRDAAVAILGPLKYTGVAMIEFKMNPATGAWVFIEVNGRFWGSLPLAVASGADFPRALFELLVDGRTAVPKIYRVGLCCRYWMGDWQWQLANLRADRRDLTLATRPLPAVAAETALHVLTLRERSDTLTLDDPLPGLVEMRRLAGSIVRGITGRLGQRMCRLAPVRRYLARRARRALRRARTVLFVCKGNVCRSPFAARLLMQLVRPEQCVLSAGYFPVADRPSPEAAVAAARRLAVDLTRHRSVLVTEAQVRAADAIFVFDRENQARMRSAFDCGRKLHYVGALSANGPLWIDDPWGRDSEGFVAIYEQIRAALISGTKASRPAVSRSVRPEPPRTLNRLPPGSPRPQPVADSAEQTA